MGRILRSKLRRPRRLRAPLRWILDRLDEHRARRLRAAYGVRRWLVSWQRDDDGRWRARLSSPSLVFTLERTGRNRTEAVERAARALALLLSFREVFQRCTVLFTPDPKSLDDSWR